MKTPTTKTILLLLIASIFFASCKPKTEAKKVETKPTSIEIPNLLNREQVLGSEKEAALYQQKFKQYSDALTKNPLDHKASLGLAELFIAEARVTGEHPYYYPAALKMIDHVLGTNPTDKDILFSAYSLKASVKLSLHQFQEGLDAGHKAVTINPYNANVYGALVDGNVELGNYNEAVTMADKMISIRPDLRSYSRVSYLREIHGDIKGAIEAMDMAVKAGYPGYESTAWARYTLGKIHENYGDLQNAEMQYRITLEERPNYAFALDGLGNIEMKKGNFDKAESFINQAIAIIPEVSFYESLAQLYISTGKKDKAIATANKIIEMMAEDEASGHKMDLDKAKIYLHLLDNKEKALKYAMIEYKVRPTNIDVNLVIAEVLIEQENYTEAKKHIEIAASTKSKKPELLLCQGMLEMKTGEKSKAKQYFKTALEENPYLSGNMAQFAKNSVTKS